MSLKQSCFNSIVKSDLKRSWWISALATLFIFMSSTSPLFNYSINRYGINGYMRYIDCVDFANEMVGNYFIGMFMAAFVVLYLFSYINKVNSVSFFHSLPATRTTLFFAHLTSSAVLVTIPMLLNCLISFLAVGRGIKASWILAEFAVYLIYSFMAMMLTVTISMLTGVSVASGIFTGIIVVLPLFLSTFVLQLCGDYLYGFCDYGLLEETLVKYVYLFPKYLLSARVLIYIVGIIALVALSLFLYKKRHLENYGEVIAFPQLKGLFKILFAFCSGILGYYYFDAFWSIKSILTMLVFGTLGAIIANMLTNKCLSFKGSLKPVLVTCGIVVLLFVAFFFDIFGFEKRLPELEDIKHAEIGGTYYDDYEYVDSGINGVGSVRVTRKNPQRMIFDTDEEIQLFRDLHKYALDHQVENDIWDDDLITPSYRIANRRHFEIVYTLKNGTVMQRGYDLPVDEIELYTSKIYNTDTYREWKYPILNEKDVVYESVQVYDSRTYYGETAVLSSSRDEAKKIIEAIRNDRRSISYDRMTTNEYGTVIRVSLVYTIPYLDDAGKEYRVEKVDTYNISKLDVNTWALLEELNLFADERRIMLEDVVGVDVYLNSRNIVDTNVNAATSFPQTESVEIYDVDVKPYSRQSAFFSEKEDIEVMYDIFINHVNEPVPKDENSYDFSIILQIKDDAEKLDDAEFKYRSGESNVREVLIRESALPEILFFAKDNM